VSKPVEISLAAFSSVAIGADGTDVEVLFPERDLALGLNLPPALAAEELRPTSQNAYTGRNFLYETS
jgi:hypothetical protein